MASDNKDLKATPSPSATAGGDALGAGHLATSSSSSSVPVTSSSDTRNAAASAAEAVRDAVNKVANEAVNAVRGAAAGVGPQGQFQVSGAPGSFFTIRGDGFSGGGGVTFGGIGAEITAWGDERIEGKVPDGAKVGDEVVVTCGDPDKKQYGRL